MNELLLILSLFIIFGSVLVWYKLFGTTGLYCYIAFATVVANIEVLLLVEAFGINQTLGNVLFASTFLATDMLSEFEGKKEANKAINVGIAATITFVILSQSWLLYHPAADDWASESFHVIFSMTPRIMIVSVVVYAIVQKIDVFLYHRWWQFTTKRFGDTRKLLWVRNNLSTLISQLINTVLYNLLAFGGIYDTPVLIQIMISSYIIFIVTSLLDTPVMYLARSLKEKGKL